MRTQNTGKTQGDRAKADCCEYRMSDPDTGMGWYNKFPAEGKFAHGHPYTGEENDCHRIGQQDI